MRETGRKKQWKRKSMNMEDRKREKEKGGKTNRDIREGRKGTGNVLILDSNHDTVLSEL